MNRVPRIPVIGEITVDTFRDFVSLAKSMNEFPTPEILVCSPGGDIGYTLAMLDDIDENRRNTLATGICQSAAAVLATAGEGWRRCTADTLFRFMPPVKEKIENENGEIEEKVPDLRYYLHSVLVARLASRLKTPVADISLLFDGEFISSTRAKELGLIDEVIFTEAPNGNADRLPGSEGKTVAPVDERIGDLYDTHGCGGAVRLFAPSETE